MEYRATNGVCSSCHHVIDTLGVLFENYDPIGRYRATDAAGPIDASAALDLPLGLTGPVANAVALGGLIVGGGQAARCASRKILGYALGRTITEPQSCEVQDIDDRFTRAGGTLPELFR